MALFDEGTTIVPARRRLSRSASVGIWALTVALFALLALTLLPSSFVIQRPGPVFNTLGSVQNSDGDDVPLISVSGAQTYPTAGALDLLTVQVVGSRERTPSWFELALAWFDPAKAVLPLDDVFPEGQTTEERNQESAVMMVDSQKEATAAALTELGYDVQAMVRVYSLTDDSAAQGILEPDDIIRAANGQAITETDELRSIINAGEGAPVELTVERAGETLTETVTPTLATVDGKDTWLIGVTTLHDYDFPIDVTIQLDNVGGPSAGMMFALGIIDTLSEGELNGGEQVAGTGTIDAAGTVGAIGGIRQKLYGAKDAGAEWFLAPESNCDEVVGHIPSGLRVFSVATLDDALTVLETIRDGGDLDALPTCS
ncbi:MAG: ATP-dependent serine peptidase containing a PDZ domain protein [Microbacterium sp. SCN 70-200]|uniref:YlbL family protein n=1 Tax=unclassified Microbacterium TaxID=2609290 RepID=UPI00086AD98F|nr:MULTISPECIES: S16 family serine protease [unclassified Microbacterium]MBN9213229.1 PDZ domain-containing protein [Microbacterium sp.]ODT40702.1 MAG: ATP-dependent serine peptidase containing a PDZ domain protein [Microbacterium sp. SCN 70-200]OJV83699.1 MAG: ATP-dependent serine peptidase containing a PDZ domain protein [Microbacterium sp. 70-16]